ncbi:MAG: hypothetical protein LBT79_01905 [Elusimicrobiota bacterium]|jgi:hypothetical protein|nr:hypothetical protein [Elusimicrobiota bacterium]
MKVKDFADKIKQKETVFIKEFKSDGYSVFVHNDKIVPLLKNEYSASDIEKLDKQTLSARKIVIVKKAWGSFIQAASFQSEEMGSITNYDAIWIRDTLWGYLALKTSAENQEAAKTILITMLDYISKQRFRMRTIIKEPSILNLPDGKMRAVHIRFNCNSPEFDDVYENGKAQNWNHKQNDALGLLLDLTLSAYKDGSLTLKELRQNNRFESLIELIAYLAQIKFYEMADSGAWEEEERVNTSSIGLVVSALENLSNLLAKNPQFSKVFDGIVSSLQLKKILNTQNINNLIVKGYEKIKKQISIGGESPSYDKTDSRYRTADAALLNLIYPANLTRLSIVEKYKILEIVSSLAGDYGIKRYKNDNYQSANFWFNNIKTDAAQESMDIRKKSYIKGSEAQWFFDSWFSKCFLILYLESKQDKDLKAAFKYTNRALSQITGNNALGADAKIIKSFALPESYNTVIYKGKTYYAPSPITPLNWAKASMTLMFEEYRKANLYS